MRNLWHPFNRKDGITFFEEQLFRNKKQVDLVKNVQGIKNYDNVFDA